MPPQQSRKHILFLEKTLLERRDRPLRGVQLFNFHLIADLVRLGHAVAVPVERSWRSRFQAFIPDAMPELIEIPNLGSFAGALLAARRLRRRRFDALLLGNVGRGLAPAVRLLSPRAAAPRTLLIAHRSARKAFLRLLRDVPMDVVAVNDEIRAGFEGQIRGELATYYGVANADAFHPPDTPKPPDAPVDFCVLGKLDPEWKGADLAMESFRALPDEVRRRCRLHLISYERPPETGDERIIAYPWTDPSRISDTLRTMDVIVVPSRSHETFSQAIVQGMLTALPAIASDLPVLAEKLDAGGGLIFSTPQELTESMRTLARDPQLRRRLGEQARRIALKRYVWSTSRFVERFLFPPQRAADASAPATQTQQAPQRA